MEWRLQYLKNGGNVRQGMRTCPVYSDDVLRCPVHSVNDDGRLLAPLTSSAELPITSCDRDFPSSCHASVKHRYIWHNSAPSDNYSQST